MKGTRGEGQMDGEAETTTSGCGGAFIERRLDATGERAGGPLGGAARRVGCCARGGGGGASAGRGLRPFESGWK